MKLRCNRIVVTGGGSGIGKAIATELAVSGAKVVITGRNEAKLKSLISELKLDCVSFIKWDVADISLFDEKIKQCEELLGGKIDGFVNSAAIGTGQLTGRGYEPWDITEEEWDTLNNINYKGAFFMLRNEINYMLENNIKGNILNLASNAACMDVIGAYGASKLAIIKWTKSFGKKYGHNGIIINGIAPGATFTPMISRYAHDINQKYERHAIERFIRPDEIAFLAHYLMSTLGEIICGHTVVADGGDNLATL